MKCIILHPLVGDFAENKDIARDVRLQQIIPALNQGEAVVLDFEHISGATQSFIHALISDLFRTYGSDILDRLSFKNCNETIQKVITLVSEYMQEST